MSSFTNLHAKWNMQCFLCNISKWHFLLLDCMEFVLIQILVFVLCALKYQSKTHLYMIYYKSDKRKIVTNKLMDLFEHYHVSEVRSSIFLLNVLDCFSVTSHIFIMLKQYTKY